MTIIYSTPWGRVALVCALFHGALENKISGCRHKVEGSPYHGLALTKTLDSLLKGQRMRPERVEVGSSLQIIMPRTTVAVICAVRFAI